MPLNPPPLAALLLAVAMTMAVGYPGAVAGPEVRPKVLSIGDGDTIRVQQGQQRITIRLACIDGPEMAQAPDGAKARNYLQTRLRLGSSVTLGPQTVDRYGRTVAEVVGEINLGLAMVEDGQAFSYRKYLGQCNAKEYLDAEFRADMVGPLGQHQQLTGVTGKALLGQGREFGQVVVGDQRPTGFAGLDRSEELLALFGKAALVGLLEAHPLVLQPHERIQLRWEVIQP